LGTKAHTEFMIATKRLARLLSPDLFINEIWFGRIGHGSKVHACQGSHAMCGTAGGRFYCHRTGLIAAHGDDHLTVNDVTCEKCREKMDHRAARQATQQTTPAAETLPGVEIERDPNWLRNHWRYGQNSDPCAVCGRPTHNNSKTRHWIHEHCGGGRAVTNEQAKELDSASDLGYQPIGADCWRKHPELHPFEVDGSVAY
jgi:hypothetical protein